MEKMELQEIIDACEKAESEYLDLYRPLLGYEDELTFYRGADDSIMDTIKEMEEKIGIQFPPDFFQIYLLSNGGRYFDITLYSFTENKNAPEDIYYKNMIANVKKEYNAPDNTILIGETTDGLLILVGIDEEGYYYYSCWNKETKEEEFRFNYLLELLVHEIDYHTGAFDIDEEEE